MNQSTLTLVGLVGLAAPAFSQTDVLYRIDAPAGLPSSWGQALVPVGDLDADGIRDLAIGFSGHGGGPIATLHSGATGAHLFTLTIPFVPLFFGSSISAIQDENGDGIQEIAMIGAHSGDSSSPDGAIAVFSGLDGTLLRNVAPPTGVYIQSHAQSSRISLSDIDGDGSGEVLCRTSSPTGGQGLSLISTRTGQVHYTITPQTSHIFVGSIAPLIADRDGDGIADLAIPVRQGNSRSIEIHSGATGLLLQTVHTDGIDAITGNHEPLIEIADITGDGQRDFASGAIFDGLVSVFSSADGDLFKQWDCDVQPIPCFGSRLIETGDLTGDGLADLIVLESVVSSASGKSVFGLDPLHGEVIFEEHFAGIVGGYSTADQIVDLTGVDPRGFASFATFEGNLMQVVVRSFVPKLGTRTCPSTPNSSGFAAELTALGSAAVSAQTFTLELRGAPALQPAFFAFGSDLTSQPFGGGTLCIGGTIGRFPAVHMDSNGNAARTIDLSGFNGEIGSTWTFQAVFRDPAGEGSSTSDALRIELLP